MQFPSRDLTQQYVSLSYQDVVQRYEPAGPVTYYLDGLGVVLFAISKSAAGSEVLTPFSTASWANSASIALNGGGGGSTVSASWASSSISASYALTSTIADAAIVAENALTASTADAIAGIQFTNTSSIINVSGSDITISQLSTGSYNAVFFDYVVLSSSNTRAGTVFGSWYNGQLSYTEVSNVDIGDTSKVTMSMALSSDKIQLIANVTNTIPWSIRAIGRYL